MIESTEVAVDADTETASSSCMWEHERRKAQYVHMCAVHYHHVKKKELECLEQKAMELEKEHANRKAAGTFPKTGIHVPHNTLYLARHKFEPAERQLLDTLLQTPLGFRRRVCTLRSRSAPDKQSHAGNRLHEKGKQFLDQKKRWMKQEYMITRALEFLQEGCTFTPDISSYAASLHRSKSLSPHRRLKAEMRHQKEKRKWHALLKEELELKHCTFHPRVCRKSIHLAGKIPGYETALHHRLFEEAVSRRQRYNLYGKFFEDGYARHEVVLSDDEIQKIVERLTSSNNGKEAALLYLQEHFFPTHEPCIGSPLSEESKRLADVYSQKYGLPSDTVQRLTMHKCQYDTELADFGATSGNIEIPSTSREFAEKIWCERLKEWWHALHQIMQSSGQEEVDATAQEINITLASKTIQNLLRDTKDQETTHYMRLMHIYTYLIQPLEEEYNGAHITFESFCSFLTSYKRKHGPHAGMWNTPKTYDAPRSSLQQEFPFHPQISPNSEAMLSKRRSFQDLSQGRLAARGAGKSMEGYPYLYTKATGVRSARRMQELILRKDRKEMEECTFHPSLGTRTPSQSKRHAEEHQHLNRVRTEILKQAPVPRHSHSQKVNYRRGERMNGRGGGGGGGRGDQHDRSCTPPSQRAWVRKEGSAKRVPPGQDTTVHSKLLRTLTRNVDVEIEAFGRSLMQRQLLNRNKKVLLDKIFK